MKRSGLDYWDKLNIFVYDNVDEFFEKNKNTCYFATTKAEKTYVDMDYSKNDNVFLMFGPESRGIPESILKNHIETCIRMPMKEGIRSLNLSNSVCAIAYEVLRQQNFQDLETKGKLTKENF